MNLAEAIKTRHSVRKYSDRSIEAEKVAAIKADIESINAESGLHIQLVLEEPRAFAAGVLKYGAFSGVKNYLVMAGPAGKETEERVGYYGEKLILLAQTLGLNSCWVGLTYKKIPGTFSLNDGEIVHCVISLGYGLDQGVQHKLRPAKDFYEAEGEAPQWFLDGMEAAMLAPTAMNQQKFRFILHGKDEVEAKALFSVFGYTVIDLGIAKCHFEIGAGKDNFRWKD